LGFSSYIGITMANKTQYEIDLRQARSSPKNSNRACLCKDLETYSKKCCDGTLWAQGIGNITYTPQWWNGINLQWQTIVQTYNELI
jgi:hypothetical protein